jgi:hypothetical protein
MARKIVKKKSRSLIKRPWILESIIAGTVAASGIGWALNSSGQRMETEYGAEVHEQVKVVKKLIPSRCDGSDCVGERYSVSLNGEISFEMDDRDLFYRINTNKASVTYRPVFNSYYDKGCLKTKSAKDCLIKREIEYKLVDVRSI